MRHKLGVYMAEGLSVDDHLKALEKYQIFEMFRDSAAPIMRREAPDAILLKYRSPQVVSKNSVEFDTFAIKGWLLKDESGAIIPNKKWPSNYLVDIGNKQYQEYLKVVCAITLNKYDYTGLFGDLLARYSVPTDFEARPVNPETTEYYTDQDWALANIALIKALQDSKTIFGNGVGQAKAFKDNLPYSLSVFRALDGGMMEGALGWGNAQIDTWIGNIAMADFLSGKGKILWMTATDDTPTDREALFSLCSFYMIKPTGRTFITYANKPYMDKPYWQELAGFDPGQSLTLCKVIEGTTIRFRKYRRATYYVNPSREETHKVGDIELPPRTGYIVKKV